MLVDPFIGIAGALSELAESEFAMLQVIFHPARFPWPQSVLTSLYNEDGSLVFRDGAEIAKAAQRKVSTPLFGAVVRLAARAGTYGRILENLRRLASPLRVFSAPGGNELIPLDNEDYPLEYHLEDLLLRQSRRFGMLLNSEELLGFVHLPSVEVRSPKFERSTAHTNAAPASLITGPGLALGGNAHRGETQTVYLSPDNRVRHMHVVGASGTGKSTLLLNMIRQDMENGQGIAVIDPHGELVDDVLKCVPEDRIDDVVLLDPSDESAAVPFNLLEAHSETEKNLLASDLVSVFQRQSTSWGDQMTIVLRNAILAFLESSRGGTLSDLKLFLLDAKFRKDFLTTVQDPEVVSFWNTSFAKLTGNKSIGPLLIRLEIFLSMKPIRRIVSQPGNALDFAHIMDDGKIFLARLSHGLVGKENAYLLGSLLVAKFQQIVMSRQAQEAEARRNFWFYADEFHHVITPSVADILTGARKYRLGMILAHQELRQLKRDDEVASAVFSIGGVRAVFRVSDGDARTLDSGFASFDARDLTTLDIGHAICRVERSDQDFNLAVPWTDAPENGAQRRRQVIEASRKRYATPRDQIEAQLKQRAPAPELEVKPPPPKQAQGAEAPTQPKKEKETERARPAPSPGRGGDEHKDIQQRIKKVAQALNFVATIEKKILEGQGVDVLLERDDATIAVEICVSTSTSHELDNNVRKCLDAGYTSIFLLSPEESRINTISKALRNQFPPEATARIRCMTPDEFVAYLGTLRPLPQPGDAPPPLPREQSARGSMIRRKFTELTPGEAQRREEEVLRILEEAMGYSEQSGA